MTISSASAGKSRINFDLAETLDDTQYSVTLDIVLSILPYPINCTATDILVEDVKVMTDSTTCPT